MDRRSGSSSSNDDVERAAVEGHVNRLKLLKRQSYGRAGVGLLRQRLMQAA